MGVGKGVLYLATGHSNPGHHSSGNRPPAAVIAKAPGQFANIQRAQERSGTRQLS
jgi:hypothetical protein